MMSNLNLRVMFNNVVVVKAVDFAGTQMKPATADINGKMPVMLLVLAGDAPNRNVLSGTVADRGGFQPGGTYLAQVLERAPNEYGKQFSWQAVEELRGSEISKSIRDIGPANVINIDENVPAGGAGKGERGEPRTREEANTERKNQVPNREKGAQTRKEEEDIKS